MCSMSMGQLRRFINCQGIFIVIDARNRNFHPWPGFKTPDQSLVWLPSTVTAKDHHLSYRFCKFCQYCFFLFPSVLPVFYIRCTPQIESSGNIRSKYANLLPISNTGDLFCRVLCDKFCTEIVLLPRNCVKVYDY